MDPRTAVAASMLPCSRLGIAAAFKAMHHEPPAGGDVLELLWSASGQTDPLLPAVLEEVRQAAAVALDAGRRLDLQIVALLDPSYPALLRCTADPPPALWIKGLDSVLALPTVAVVGSRAATPYALRVAERIAAELADRGIVVASGLARGVDSAAHRGSLEAGGPTVAVLGSGLDRIYPPEHEPLAARIAATGAVISELAPGAPPLPGHFPLRNRIISGLSLAVVVVEASERSGSLITARWALEQGRDVLVVPGSVLSGRNRGSHALLKDGAAVVETADDILQHLGWGAPAGPGRVSSRSVSDPVLAQMQPGEAYDLDLLAETTGISAVRLLARLTELELAGRVSAAGGRYVRLE